MPFLFCHRFPSRSSGVACLASLGLGISLLCPPPVQAAISHHQSVVDYARATAIQRHLEAIPNAERTRSQYEHALDAYRAVYHGDPASPDAARSIAAVADLLAGEGRCVRDAKLFHDAVAQWEFLRHQYPTSSLRQRALFEEGQIEQHDLHDRTVARKIYRSFLLHYPQDPLAEQARAGLHGNALAEVADVRTRVPQPTTPLPAKEALRKDKPSLGEKNTVPSSDPSHENRLAAAPDVRQKKWLPRATTSPKSLPSATTLLDVRYWAESGTTRLAVDLGDAVPYHIYSEQNGRQITVIFFGAHSAAALLDHSITAAHDANLRSMRVSMLTSTQAALVVQLNRAVDFSSFVLSNPARLILDLRPAAVTNFAQTRVGATPQISAVAPAQATPPPKLAASVHAVRGMNGGDDTAPSLAEPLPPPPFSAEPAPNSQHSMTRVLGLRIRRIVIDAGHGGHDSGTIGPDGIEEKDVALGVALRLGRLLQQRLGAEVIYTRRTDKYVPLEERTAIANQAHADLFLSIHANSSSDPQVRGIETYFLNFTSSPDAMSVASRENADSNRSVYELSDLVRKIALSDKIDESREFADDVQQELYDGLSSGNPGLRNRGVKQAPFVVLIGAQMPSILAEISFLTNPDSAMELSHPAYRERLAEALYRGVAEYVQGMSGVRITKTLAAEALPDPAE
ncbi:MAG: N-acetylmuramoyl-L-alanine amidase [Terriglobia bacterium]|nr:N-acetylmuramoyl-L-alanine amidase [Terriglobia bacterium]